MNPTTTRVPAGSTVKAPSARHKREAAVEAVIDREWQVADAAYYLAEKRGFAPGRELQDWFQAAALIDQGLPGHRER
jgi:hypothetical protein